MENQKDKKMLQKITEKLGFDVKAYLSSNINDVKEAHENDNIVSPFDVLSLDELLFLRKYYQQSQSNK